MRILAIRGSNLTSLAGDFEIDFDAEPLASAGIFAITGPTGAGKSTLLDAMCLALFADVPRLATVKKSAGTLGADELRADDPRAILRHGAKSGYAEVEFLSHDGNQYRARWAVERARTGTLKASTHEFWNARTGERLGDKKDETRGLIEAKVGLNSEQFGRAVLLAQGDFDAFVRADANDRAILLERITGSDVYARLGKAAFEKARAMQEATAQVDRQIAAQNGLDDDARAAAEQALELAQGQLSAITVTVDGLVAESSWYQRADEIQSRVTQSEQVLADAKAAHAGATERRASLDKNRSAMAFAADWQSLVQARERQSVVVAEQARLDTDEGKARAVLKLAAEAEFVFQAELEKAEQAGLQIAPQLEEARTLDRQLAEVEAELAKLDKAVADQTSHFNQKATERASAAEAFRHARDTSQKQADWLNEHKARRELSVRAEELGRRIDAFREAQAAKESSFTDLANKLGSLKVSEDRLAGAKATFANAERALAEQQSLVEAAAKKAIVPDKLRKMNMRREHLSFVEPKIATYRQLAERSVELEGAQSGVDAELVALSSEVASANERSLAIQNELPEQVARRDEAMRAVSLSEAAADEAAERLRETLIDGEPCPVCGSKYHQLGAIGALLRERLDADRERIADLENVVSRLNAEQAVLVERGQNRAAQKVKLDARRGQLSSTLAQTKTAFQNAKNEFVAACQTAELEPPDVSDMAAFADQVRAELTELTASTDEALASQSASEMAQTEADASRVTTEAARAASGKAELARTQAAHAVELAESQAKARDQKLTDVGLELDAALGRHFDWRHVDDAASELNALVKEWNEASTTYDRLVAELPDLATIEDVAKAAVIAAEEAKKSVETQQRDYLARQKEFVAKRAVIFDGKPTRSVADEVTASLSAAREVLDRARVAASQSRLADAAASASRSRGAERLEGSKKEVASCEETLTQRLDGTGFAEADVASAASLGVGALRSEELALQALDRDVEIAAATLAQRSMDLEELRSNGIPDRSCEETAAALSRARDEQDDARRGRDEADLALRMDDRVRATTADLRARRAKAAEAARVWEQLNELIGSAGGDKFRRIAQGFTLDCLIEQANLKLAQLRPRYVLERGTGGDMMIQVIDNDMAGEVRGLHNLSGGERFLVSVALALGLSEMSSGRGTRIESLFIDEGFGGLDSQSLGSAVALLESLHATGRRVGVISHMEEVKDRIPVRIEVAPVARGTSEITIAALF